VEDNVSLPGLQLLGQRLAALLGGDVLDQANAAGDGTDGEQIHADHDAGHGHVLLGHLHPATGRCAQIQTYLRLLEEAELAVQLD